MSLLVIWQTVMNPFYCFWKLSLGLSAKAVALIKRTMIQILSHGEFEAITIVWQTEFAYDNRGPRVFLKYVILSDFFSFAFVTNSIFCFSVNGVEDGKSDFPPFAFALTFPSKENLERKGLFFIPFAHLGLVHTSDGIGSGVGIGSARSVTI